jgi:DNA-binding transcriptional LysR family regulator
VRVLVSRAKVLHTTLGRGGPGLTYLWIGCITSAVSDLLPRVLPPFPTAGPHVVAVVQEMGQRAQTTAVRDGAIDVGICRVLAEDDDAELMRMVDEPLHYVLPVRHRLAGAGRCRARGPR